MSFVVLLSSRETDTPTPWRHPAHPDGFRVIILLNIIADRHFVGCRSVTITTYTIYTTYETEHIYATYRTIPILRIPCYMISFPGLQGGVLDQVNPCTTSYSRHERKSKNRVPCPALSSPPLVISSNQTLSVLPSKRAPSHAPPPQGFRRPASHYPPLLRNGGRHAAGGLREGAGGHKEGHERRRGRPRSKGWEWSGGGGCCWRRRQQQGERER